MITGNAFNALVQVSVAGRGAQRACAIVVLAALNAAAGTGVTQGRAAQVFTRRIARARHALVARIALRRFRIRAVVRGSALDAIETDANQAVRAVVDLGGALTTLVQFLLPTWRNVGTYAEFARAAARVTWITSAAATVDTEGARWITSAVTSEETLDAAWHIGPAVRFGIDPAEWRPVTATGMTFRVAGLARAIDTRALTAIVVFPAGATFDAIYVIANGPEPRVTTRTGVEIRHRQALELTVLSRSAAAHIGDGITRQASVTHTKQTRVGAGQPFAAFRAVAEGLPGPGHAHQVITAPTGLGRGITGSKALLFNARPGAVLPAVRSFLARNAAIVFFAGRNLAVRPTGSRVAVVVSDADHALA